MRLARTVPGVAGLTWEISKKDIVPGSSANASSVAAELEATQFANQSRSIESRTNENPPQPPSPNSSSLPRWPAVHHVALVGTDLIAYDSQGRRLMEGALVDGVRVTSIRPDVVTFEHEGRSFRQAVKGFANAGVSGLGAVR
jgi:hypothetical protein